MEEENQHPKILTKKNVLLLLTGLIVLVSFVTLVTLITIRRTSPPIEQNPTPTLFPISKTRTEKTFSQQHSLPGRTTENDIKQREDVIDSTSLSNGDTRYDISSINPFRPTEVITRNSIVIFEKTIIPSDQDIQGDLTLADVNQLLGNPEQIISGSSEYGPHNNTYSYSTKGFVFIANPISEAVYEIHSFIPMTTEQYLQNYGGQINVEDRDKL